MTEKFLTVAGAVAEPVTLRVPVGITLAECVAAAGGPTVPDANYIVGGVMMGRLEDEPRRPGRQDDRRRDRACPTTTSSSAAVARTGTQIVRIGRSACDQCSFCTELCPRWLLGHPIEPHRAMRSLEFNLVGEANVIGTAFCCECNLCSLYSCPEDLDPKNVCTQNKRRLAAEKRRWENPPFNPRRPELHMDNRKAPMAPADAEAGPARSSATSGRSATTCWRPPRSASG